MRLGAPSRPHLEKLYRDAALGKLPRRFRAGETTTDNPDEIFHESSMSVLTNLRQ
jgi:hypothetical protein